MKRNNFKMIALWLIVLTVNIAFSQSDKTCKTKEPEDFDLNTITTKCAVKVDKGGNNKKINKINISVSNARIERARIKRKRMVAVGGVDASNEVVLRSTGRMKTPEIVENLSRKISAEEIAKSVPLTAVKNVPVFPACLSKSQDKHLECFNDQLAKHIEENLKYPTEAALNKIEGDVWVRFVINSKGDVSNIDVRGPKNGKDLEDEVREVIALLPRFKPGMLNGKTVNIKYSLPVNFSVDKDSQ